MLIYVFVLCILALLATACQKSAEPHTEWNNINYYQIACEHGRVAGCNADDDDSSIASGKRGKGR